MICIRNICLFFFYTCIKKRKYFVSIKLEIRKTIYLFALILRCISVYKSFNVENNKRMCKSLRKKPIITSVSEFDYLII
ncbi:hypothetical protein RJT34_15639 [Clitoria ternatea]|uniref:Uncharacterized protein n=1 Tax=Clitoria ternatea TaxID=43366 RepID=A0AAN9J770_CLITE